MKSTGLAMRTARLVRSTAPISRGNGIPPKNKLSGAIDRKVSKSSSKPKFTDALGKAASMDDNSSCFALEGKGDLTFRQTLVIKANRKRQRGADWLVP